MQATARASPSQRRVQPFASGDHERFKHLFEEIYDAGGEVVAVDVGIDPTTPVGKFARTIMLALNEMELERIKEFGNHDSLGLTGLDALDHCVEAMGASVRWRRPRPSM